jgi:hypothetical protein
VVREIDDGVESVVSGQRGRHSSLDLPLHGDVGSVVEQRPVGAAADPEAPGGDSVPAVGARRKRLTGGVGVLNYGHRDLADAADLGVYPVVSAGKDPGRAGGADPARLARGPLRLRPPATRQAAADTSAVHVSHAFQRQGIASAVSGLGTLGRSPVSTKRRATSASLMFSA